MGASRPLKKSKSERRCATFESRVGLRRIFPASEAQLLNQCCAKSALKNLFQRPASQLVELKSSTNRVQPRITESGRPGGRSPFRPSAPPRRPKSRDHFRSCRLAGMTLCQPIEGAISLLARAGSPKVPMVWREAPTLVAGVGSVPRNRAASDTLEELRTALVDFATRYNEMPRRSARLS